METEYKIRQIKPKLQDFLKQFFDSSSPLPDKSISEFDISTFCRNCDYHQLDNMCKIVDSNDQARYAMRKQCGWASMDNVRGNMTESGFIPSETAL